IDVIEWDDNPATFIASSLKPAIIQQVVVTNEDEKEAIVVVKKDQLSLAIGKHGINIRLAVKLSGWKLEIIDAEEFADKKTEISSKTPISFADKIKKSKEEEKEAEAEEAAAEEAVAEEAQSD
ncbi:KH domain-containing protein, partial [bacterium]|nr:KH domain-containing protein [bacterium]